MKIIDRALKSNGRQPRRIGSVQISEAEILADLHYPESLSRAPVGRSQRPLRRSK